MERNVMGELSMYRQSGTKPNFSEIGRRYGMSRKTVARYWHSGGDLDDGRSARGSGFDCVRVSAEKPQGLDGSKGKPPRRLNAGTNILRALLGDVPMLS